MVTMSAVWDRAAAVIEGRRSILVSLVLLLVWLPGLVLSGLRFATLGAAATAPGGGGSPLLSMLALVASLLGAIGHLALVAVASDPAVSRGDALAIALRRLPLYLGLVLLLIVAAAILATPIGVAFAGAYPSLAAMQAGEPPQLSAGTGLFVSLYGLAYLALIVWAEARVIAVLAPVVVNERRGIDSYARAFRLTRGLTWRIVGVVLLFAVVALVSVFAVRGVVGVVLRLILGADGIATTLFVTAAIVSLVACALAIVAAAFTAQLYAATSARQPAA